jgi:hypothetical protein
MFVEVPTIRAAQNNQIAIKLEAGFEGLFRSEKWVPLLITIGNSGPDVSGELRVTASGTAGLTASAYKTTIDLPTNSSKQVFLYITLEYIAQNVKVELANDSGIITDVTRPVKPIAPYDVLFALITESPRGTIDLKSVHIGAGDSQQVNWRLENIPRNVEGLSALDVLILSDVDTGNLSVEQRRAIDGWVLAGGHLVVTGGPNWQKTQAGVIDLLPLKPTTTTTLASLPSTAKYSGRPSDTLTVPAGSPIIVAQGALSPDAQVLVQESNVPVLVRRKHGSGTVDYMTTDPANEPYQSWKNRGSFWFSVFTSTGQQPTWSEGIAQSGQAVVAANYIKGLRLPDVIQLGLFLFLYIIVIGPLNYLILKRLGRRELAWLTIPIVIFACSTTAYLTGFSLRGAQATINRMALVQVWPDSERAHVSGILGVLAPRRAIYTLTVPNAMTVRLLEPDSVTGVNTANFTIYEDNDYSVRDFPVDAGLTAAFAVSGITQTTPIEGTATIRFNNRNGGAPRVEGKVKNTTNMILNNAVVLATNGSFPMGTLQPGEEKSFSFNLNINTTQSQSPPLTLGNALRAGYSSGMLYGGGGYPYGQERTVQDIMGNKFNSYRGYNFGYGDTPEQQEDRRRQAFVQSLISTYEPSGGRGDKVFLAAWVESSPITMDLKGAPFTTEDTTLYMYGLKVNITEDDTEVTLPNAFLTWTSVDSSSRRDVAPYNLSLQAGDRVVFRYAPLPSIRLKEVTSIGIVAKTNRYQQGIISLWNWATSKWEVINISNQYSTTVSNAQDYLGPDNVIEVQVEAAANTSVASYERIDLTLYGILAS